MIVRTEWYSIFIHGIQLMTIRSMARISVGELISFDVIYSSEWRVKRFRAKWVRANLNQIELTHLLANETLRICIQRSIDSGNLALNGRLKRPHIWEQHSMVFFRLAFRFGLWIERNVGEFVVFLSSYLFHGTQGKTKISITLLCIASNWVTENQLNANLNLIKLRSTTMWYTVKIRNILLNSPTSDDITVQYRKNIQQYCN